MDILETTIHCMLYGPKFTAPRSTKEFDHKVGKTRDLRLMRDADRRASLMRWVASLIVEQGLTPASVATHSKPIVKVSLNFPAKLR